MSPLRIGLVLPLTAPDPQRILSFARRAEELGFDGVFAFDHFFPPGAPAHGPSLEAYASLAAVAAVTTRITVGTLVTRASLRSAAMLAKQAVALDDIARGRFVLGIGTGDAVSKDEHVAFGLPYLDSETRGEHLVETVRAIRTMFRGQPWPGGDHVAAVRGPLLPPPRTVDGPRVWIGGAGPAAVRLAAREADAWNGWGLDVTAFGERVSVLRRESRGRVVEATWAGAVVVGRDDDEARRIVADRRARGITGDAFVGDADAAAGWLERLASAGASWAILLAAGGRDRIELIAEQLLPRVATLA